MAISNSLVKAQTRTSLSAYLSGDAVKAKINEVVGSKDGQRFISAIVSAVTVNPALQDCSNPSILSAALLGESLKLSPSPQLGHYYLVPYDTKNGKQVSFQLGYHGILQLAMRSGYYKKINVLPIKEGELVRYDPLEEEIEVSLIENEEERDNAPTMGYYAMFEYTNGFKKAMYWSKAKMMNHAKRYSKGYASDLKNGTAYTFWSKQFDDMACKTMIRQLIGKYGIMSIDLETGYTEDGKIINNNGTTRYAEADELESVPETETTSETAEGTVVEDKA